MYSAEGAPKYHLETVNSFSVVLLMSHKVSRCDCSFGTNDPKTDTIGNMINSSAYVTVDYASGYNGYLPAIRKKKH